MSGQACDVAVIGAGLSGLYSALLLEARGMKVRVLEAQNRVGGRIHSMRQLGSNAEAGGTYIGAGYRRTMALADRFDISLIDVTPILKFYREQELVLGDEIIRQSEWPDHPANPFPPEDRELMPWNYHRVVTMRENPLAGPEDWLDPKYAQLDVSMHQWLRDLGLSDNAIKFAYGINTTFGADARDVSALLMLFRAAFSKAQRKLAPEGKLGFTVENGVARIPVAMAAALTREVELKQTIVGLTSEKEHALVTTADGSEFRARRVICSLPFSVLRRIKIKPGLKGSQAAAVDELPSQALTQFYIGVKKPFWTEDGYSPSMFTDSTAGMVAAARSANDPTTVTHLTAWVIGPKAQALTRAGASAGGQAVIEAIERIRPAASGRLELIAHHAWGEDPCAGGAWAYFKPGQISRLAPNMGASHGRIHFCGEHLAVANRGMEAALETAETVVDEVFRAESGHL